jgi:hypothetical protein
MFLHFLFMDMHLSRDGNSAYPIVSGLTVKTDETTTAYMEAAGSTVQKKIQTLFLGMEGDSQDLRNAVQGHSGDEGASAKKKPRQEQQVIIAAPVVAINFRAH